MGIGLVSYGVAEPISHFATPPHGLAEPGTPQAAVRALQYSYFDWGLHAWAIFAVFGLAIAYSTYRKGRRTLVSQLFYPLLGERVNGPIGKAIDVLAVFATLFGTTTSLGLGALQVNNGLGIAVRASRQLRQPGPDHRVRHGRVHDLGGDRGQQGHQVPQPGQRRAGDRPVRLHAGRRPDRVPRQPLHRVPRHLRHGLLPDEPAGHRLRRPRVDAVVDLLHDGLVGLLGRLRRRLPGPHLPRPHDPRLHHGRPRGSHRRLLHLVHRLRRHRHPRRHVPGRHHREADRGRHQQRLLRHPGRLPVRQL